MNKHALTLALAAAFAAAPAAAFASEADLLARIEKLAAELEQVKAELAASKKAPAAVAAQPAAAPAAAPAAVAAAPAPVAASAYASPAAAAAAAPKTVLTGYGEVNYNRPTKNASAAQADVRRAVIGVNHRFDEKTKLVAEFEWEHAVTSAEDAGEAAVEQLYVEHEFRPGMSAKAGLFLIPSGLLNTNHEPTAFYGVERNFVETAIIPSTWREAGVGLSGTLENGLSWDAGITTTFDLGKWDASSDEGRESPLGAIHQEGQLARARNAGFHGALNWRGVPGLLVGGSVFTGKVSHNAPDFAAPDARLTLWDVHARYTPGAWDLSAVYARGSFSGIEALNDTFAGQPSPVPSSFYGWYAQAAYKLWQSNDYTLSPFVRYERFNTAKSYTAVAPGLGAQPQADEAVVTAGANFRIGEGVVLKADYQKFKEDSSRNRVNLGVGYNF